MHFKNVKLNRLQDYNARAPRVSVEIREAKAVYLR